jgi:hypothetical protein
MIADWGKKAELLTNSGVMFGKSIAGAQTYSANALVR